MFCFRFCEIFVFQCYCCHCSGWQFFFSGLYKRMPCSESSVSAKTTDVSINLSFMRDWFWPLVRNKTYICCFAAFETVCLYIT